MCGISQRVLSMIPDARYFVFGPYDTRIPYTPYWSSCAGTGKEYLVPGINNIVSFSFSQRAESNVGAVLRCTPSSD